MKGTFNIILGLVLFWGTTIMGYSQDSLQYHDAEIDYVHIDEQMLDQYRDDPDFQYQVSQPKPAGWWDQFISWLKRNLLSLLQVSNDSGLLTWFFYILLAGSLLFLILKMLGMDLHSFLQKKPPTNQITAWEIKEDNIHSIDFNRLIAKHTREKDYRQVIRLFYLFALRKLSDGEKIRWQPGKTNKEYLMELGTGPYRQTFLNLSYYFEYIWYGNFGVPDSLLKNVQALFNQFTKELEEESD